MSYLCRSTNNVGESCDVTERARAHRSRLPAMPAPPARAHHESTGDPLAVAANARRRYVTICTRLTILLFGK